MSFKRLALILFGSVMLLSCGLKTGEKAPQQKPPSYSGAGYNCVGEIPQALDKYVSNLLSENEINEFVRCLQKSFSSFAELTRGRDESSYSPDEIRLFLQTYFIKGRVMSDELTRQFMVIKRVLIGGEADRISRVELYLAIELLEDLRKEAIRLKPHLPVLNPQLVLQQDPHGIGHKLAQANVALKQSIQVFSARLQQVKNPYAYSDLESFLREFRVFIDWSRQFPQGYDVGQWVEFLKIFKELTVSPANKESIAVGDWTPLLESMARWYLAFLQYQIGVKDQPLLLGVGFQNVLYLAQELFDLIENSLQRQPTKAIQFSQTDRLALALQGVRWLPAKVRGESVANAVRVLFKRVFGDALLTPSARGEEWVSLGSVSTMKTEFYRWAYVQMNLDSQYRVENAASLPVNSFVPSLQGSSTIPTDILTVLRGLRNSDWDEFYKITNLSRPLFTNGDARIQLVTERQFREFNLNQGFANLSGMNLLRTVTLLIFRGYAEVNRAPSWSGGITEDELQKFYEDFREIGIDVGFVDPRSFTSGRRSYIEGNLFTYAADGYKNSAAEQSTQLSFVETMHLFGFLFSGGQVSMGIFKDLKSLCPEGPIDIFGQARLERACVKNHLVKAVENNFSNGPWAIEHLRSSTPENRLQYAQNLLDTAYSPAHSRADYVEASEITTLAVVLHYAEAVMTRFDADQDGLLNDLEIRAATPLFVEFIQVMARKTGRGEYDYAFSKAIFRLMLEKQALPEWYNVMGILDHWGEWTFSIDLGFWRADVPVVKQPEITLDRTKMSRVFRSIVQELYKASAVPSEN